MILARLIMTLSIAMAFFYFQTTCQRILCRQFAGESFRSIASVIRLQFPSLRRSLEEFGSSADYRRLRRLLECHFLALTYLPKNVANVNRPYSYEERLVTLHFPRQLLALIVRRQLEAGGKKAILRLTSVLEHFANVVGPHVNTVGGRNLTTAHYFTNL
jgi:hypothetical protein